MSQLILIGHTGVQFKLNITQFRAPMSASISSVQTKHMQHHFPIRAGQPDIQFTAHFSSIDAKHEFQNFVRLHQRSTHNSSYARGAAASTRGAVVLRWPERNIIDWSGYITSLQVREARFEYAPRVTFGVMLTDSMMSQTTTIGSRGRQWQSIIGSELPAYLASLDTTWLQPPIPPQEAPQPEQQQSNVVGTIVNSIENIVGSLFR